MSVDTGVRVVLCTCASAEEGEMISRQLVESKLAACCNIIPHVSSIYHWEGKVNRDEEALIIIKTAAEKVPAVIQRITQIHSYELPEIISLPVVGGCDGYLNWVNSMVGDKAI